MGEHRWALPKKNKITHRIGNIENRDDIWKMNILAMGSLGERHLEDYMSPGLPQRGVFLKKVTTWKKEVPPPDLVERKIKQIKESQRTWRNKEN